MKYIGHEVEFTLHSVRLTTNMCGSRFFTEKEHVSDVRMGGAYLGQVSIYEKDYESFMDGVAVANDS